MLMSSAMPALLTPSALRPEIARMPHRWRRARYHMHSNDFIALDAVIDSSGILSGAILCEKLPPAACRASELVMRPTPGQVRGKDAPRRTTQCGGAGLFRRC